MKQTKIHIHIGNYILSTMHLNTTQHGAILLLNMILLSMKNKKEVRLDDCPRLCRLSKEDWEVLSREILEFFDVSTNPFDDTEYVTIKFNDWLS